MSFDRIDRAFHPKPAAGPVRLECVVCGATGDVAMLYPLWPGGPARAVPLCPSCGRSAVPPAEAETIYNCC